MSDAALMIRQTRWALLGVLRNPRVIVFSVAFPIVLLVLFNGIFTGGSDETAQFAGGTIRASAYFTAGMSAYAIMMSAFSTIAIGLTTQRESGQLKRLRATPMPSWIFVAAQVLRAIAQVVLMVAALLLIGHFAFDVAIDGEALLGIAVYVALGTAAMATLGIALTALMDSADAASTIAPFSATLISFVSGVFIPVDQLPNWLEDIGRIFPLYHLAEGLQRALAENAGTGLSGGNVAVLLVWTLGALAVSAKRFRWEPQSAGR